MAVELVMPRLSESMLEGTVARWLARDGDTVAPGQEIAAIDTDLATEPFAAPEGGILRILVPEGAVLPLGEPIGLIDDLAPLPGQQPLPWAGTAGAEERSPAWGAVPAAEPPATPAAEAESTLAPAAPMGEPWDEEGETTEFTALGAAQVADPEPPTDAHEVPSDVPPAEAADAAPDADGDALSFWRGSPLPPAESTPEDEGDAQPTPSAAGGADEPSILDQPTQQLSAVDVDALTAGRDAERPAPGDSAAPEATEDAGPASVVEEAGPEQGLGAPEDAPEPEELPAPPVAAPEPMPATAAGRARRRVSASPVARRLARKLGIELESVTGSGPDGRIVRADVQAAMDRGDARPPLPEGARRAAPSESSPPPPDVTPVPLAEQSADDEPQAATAHPAPAETPHVEAPTPAGVDADAAPQAGAAPTTEAQPETPEASAAEPEMPAADAEPETLEASAAEPEMPAADAEPETLEASAAEPEMPAADADGSPEPTEATALPMESELAAASPEPDVIDAPAETDARDADDDESHAPGAPAEPDAPEPSQEVAEQPAPAEATAGPAEQQGQDVAERPGTPSAPGGARGKGEAEIVELTRPQQTIARRMAESRATIPDFHVTVEIDAAPLQTLRSDLAETRPDLPAPTVSALVLRAAAVALRAHPRLNGAYRDGRVEQYPNVNVGFAVDAGGSLVVPVVHNADRLSVSEIAARSRDLTARARAGGLRAPDVASGTFTVSNLGTHGVDAFTAVITPGQAAILSVGQIAARPVVRDGEVVAGQTMRLVLTVDHRAVYGAEAAAFVGRVRQLLERPTALLA